MKISLIVAVDKKNGIGKNNQLPWHLPADLKHFKKITTGFPIIMGRKTYDSIGKALPNRRNIIISRQKNLQINDVELSDSLENAISMCKNEQEIFIIGGAQIFEQSLSLANTLYLTVINYNFEADTFFPELNKNQWKEIASESHEPDEMNKYPYEFKKFEKI